MAGTLFPGLAWAAEPCPPPRVSVSGGSSVATACEMTAGRRYSTNFNLTENPISEGGVWFNNGLLWTKVRTANGLAFGTNGPRNTYDDSYAYLSGFGPNQQGEAVIYVSPSLVGDPHEVELLLRWADSTHIARGYECLFNHHGGVQIVRWNGPFGNYSVLSGTRTPQSWSRPGEWRCCNGHDHRKHDHRLHQWRRDLRGYRLDVDEWSAWDRLLQAHRRPEHRPRNHKLHGNVSVASLHSD